MKNFKQIISELSQEEMVQILKDNKILSEKRSYRCDCTLRDMSRKIEKEVVNYIAIKLATEHYCVINNERRKKND